MVSKEEKGKPFEKGRLDKPPLLVVYEWNRPSNLIGKNVSGTAVLEEDSFGKAIIPCNSSYGKRSCTGMTHIIGVFGRSNQKAKESREGIPLSRSRASYKVSVVRYRDSLLEGV